MLVALVLLCEVQWWLSVVVASCAVVACRRSCCIVCGDILWARSAFVGDRRSACVTCPCRRKRVFFGMSSTVEMFERLFFRYETDHVGMDVGTISLEQMCELVARHDERHSAQVLRANFLHREWPLTDRGVVSYGAFVRFVAHVRAYPAILGPPPRPRAATQ